MPVCASRWPRAIQIVFFVAAATLGTAPSAGEQAAPSSDVRADIERLMELMGAYDNDVIEQMGSVMAEQAARMIGAEDPEAIERCTEIALQAVGEMLSDGDFREEMNAIYAKHLSHEDIRQMIAFYETPAGRKSIEVTPELAESMLQATMRWIAKVNPVIQERVTSQLREEGLIE